MADLTKLTETARILDTLEARQRPLPGTAVALATLVVREQGLPYTEADVVAAGRVAPAASPCPERATVAPKAPLPIGPLALIAGLVSLGVGGMVGLISHVFYAAFMATICTWIGSCFLLRRVRDWAETSSPEARGCNRGGNPVMVALSWKSGGSSG